MIRAGEDAGGPNGADERGCQSQGWAAANG